MMPADPTMGKCLPEDLEAAGWVLMQITYVAKPPPSKLPFHWRAVAYCEGQDFLPWVRDWGMSADHAVYQLAERLRRYWVRGDGQAGLRED